MILNRGSAALHALGIAPNYLVALKVRALRSERSVVSPLAMTVFDSERYPASTLGPDGY